DHIYRFFGFHPQALLGQAAEIMPVWGEWAGALFLLFLSIKPVIGSFRSRFKLNNDHQQTESNPDAFSGISSDCTTPT
ncbi:MAG: permease, partial [Deltaproteobacteria bacterium]|nr:permease [Deltaproteobacteria bacterium]